jgi:mannose-1-phosphate guanylyltransferase
MPTSDALPFVAVIMAGGQGQRFWPLSTAAVPKQFLDLERRGRTLIQATYDRLLPLVDSVECLYVATGERYGALVRDQLPELPDGNLLIEPTGRDSAPAIALASLTIHERRGGATLGFFSADHRIGDLPSFEAAVRAAHTLANDARGLVTLGITPTHAATGYGYIERGEPCGSGFKVARFVEKPTAVGAQHYLETGTFAWNAGIFVWRSDVILEELDLHVPELMRPLRQARLDRSVAEVFPTLAKISIDYALMERTERAYVIPVDCDWDDIGDWVALDRLLRRGVGERGATNTVVGRHVGYEASGNIIYTEGTEDVVVTVGVHDLIVVKRGDTVLLVAKDRVSDIKAVLQDARLAE